MAPAAAIPSGAQALHWDPAAERLVALARNAHRNVARRDDVDYWYRLGQRNAYAHAAGILIGRGVDSAAFAISERLTAALEAGVTDLGPLLSTALGGPTPGSLSQSPTWLGPVAFRAQYGSDHRIHLGIDHEYGMRWGAAGDQRISLRHPPGADSGLLYAYDPTWDEYAVLSRTASVQAVQAAFTQAVATDPHMAVTDFAALVAALYVAMTLQTVTCPEPERQGLEL
ncbi:MAG: hypothetical protein ABJA74_11140 [Lapillicoccus sp.]